MVSIKKQPEDFIVDEQLFDAIRSQKTTAFHLCLLEKTNYTTQRAVTHIAQHLHISQKNIRYAGTKDKHAQTSQFITIKGVSKEALEQINLQDITITHKGYAKRHLSLGDLAGNTFHILLCNLQKPLSSQPSSFYVPNYFDDQRFSSQNVIIGKHILRREFQQATQLLLNERDFGEDITKHLQEHPNDYIGALRIMPRSTLLFYIHSVQSLLFNKELSMMISKHDGTTTAVPYSQGLLIFPQHAFIRKPPFTTLPLIGYLTQTSALQQEVLAQEDITARQFLTRSIPFLAQEGAQREAFCKVEHFSFKKPVQQDDGFYRQRISFHLPKGSYATIVVKQVTQEKTIQD